MANRYRPTGTSGLFSEESRLEKLSRQGDPLERLNGVVDWEYFRDTLERMHIGGRMVKAGPRPYDPVLMFKILILQRYYNLSDHQLEYQILDRLTFCRFLGLSLNDRVPDEKTVWAFRERLVSMGLEKELFDLFADLLERHGLIANQGKIVDASFVTAPRPRNKPEENKTIKQGGVPKGWGDSPNKKRQKDTDARWTKKNNETYFGYKDHIKVDNGHKFIEGYTCTDAAVHDSQALGDLLDQGDAGQDLWADSAYTGEQQEGTIKRYGINGKVYEKGKRNSPLTQAQKVANREKSKVRARVEHVFGFMEQSMGALHLRSIGMSRARGFTGLVNLTYNLFRYEQVVRIDRIRMPGW